MTPRGSDLYDVFADMMDKAEQANDPVLPQYFYNELEILERVDPTNLRLGQLGAINCILRRLEEGYSTSAVVLPMAYGKSDTVRLTAIEAYERDLCCGSLLVTPSATLRDQLVSREKIREMLKRYIIRWTNNRKLTFNRIESWSGYLFQNEEHFISMTTQMLTGNAEAVCEIIKERVARTGKPFFIFIDECHQLAESKSWGQCVPWFVDAGAHVVLLTATEERSDGHKVPYFKCKNLSQEEQTIQVPRAHPTDETKIIRENRVLTRKLVEIIPDYKVSIKQGLEEGAYCDFSFKLLDIDIDICNDNAEERIAKKISEMSETECAKWLSRLVRDPRVIEAAVGELIEQLTLKNANGSGVKGIVFCGNDLGDSNADGHAKMIQSFIEFAAPDLKVVIATSNQEEPDKVIENFAAGVGDILIVKQMASMGLDIHPIKVALDLSSVRTRTAWIQRIGRANRHYKNHKSCIIILPCDRKAVRLIEQLKEKEGVGTVITDSELISEEECDREEKAFEAFEVTAVNPHSYADISNFESITDSEYEQYGKHFVVIDPTSLQTQTHATLTKRGKKLFETNPTGFAKLKEAAEAIASGSEEQNEPTFVDADAEMKKAKAIISSAVRKAAGQMVPENATNKDWKPVFKRLHRALKEAAQIPYNKQFEGVASLTVSEAKRMAAVCEKVCANVVGKHKRR